MSEISAKDLAVVATIKEGITIGTKNIGAILVNLILWLVTVWIPYLNVGTTIGLFAGIVSKASRGEVIPMTEIFDPKYRKYMGEYFLTAGLIGLGVGVGTAFFVIPGIVICIAWSLALLLVIDKGKNPTEAITLSNNCTYGNKWKIFGVYFLTTLAFGIVIAILSQIPVIGAFLAVIVGLFMMFVIIGLQASVYKRLTEGV